jgi:transcription-repair coupling factor (superfamily II helicase)
VLAALWQELQRPVVFLADRMPRVLSAMEELGLYLPQAERMLFSEPNALFYEPLPWGLGTRQSRITVLKKLAFDSLIADSRQETPPPIIFTSIRALMTKTMPRRDFVRSTLALKRGKRLKLNDLLHQLLSLGYQPVNTVVEIGQFAHRGGLVDVWSMSESFPARLDFFDDEVDTLRWFDASTQRTMEAAHQVVISPAREFIWDYLQKPPGTGRSPLCEMDIPNFTRKELVC